MSLQDKKLTCSDCGQEFTFTVEEQEFYISKQYTNEPKRCSACRQARKSNSTYEKRQMFPATCATCGKECTVPFEPKTGRPVYCRDCYMQRRKDRGGSGGGYNRR